jgi:hypothetical protein
VIAEALSSSLRFYFVHSISRKEERSASQGRISRVCETHSTQHSSHLQSSIQDLVGVVLGSTGLAVVLVWSHLAIAESHAGTVLPDLASLALDHDTLMVYISIKSHSVRVAFLEDRG